MQEPNLGHLIWETQKCRSDVSISSDIRRPINLYRSNRLRGQWQLPSISCASCNNVFFKGSCNLRSSSDPGRLFALALARPAQSVPVMRQCSFLGSSAKAFDSPDSRFNGDLANWLARRLERLAPEAVFTLLQCLACRHSIPSGLIRSRPVCRRAWACLVAGKRPEQNIQRGTEVVEKSTVTLWGVGHLGAGPDH